MQRVHGVLVRLAEDREVRRVRVAVDEDDVVGVDLADGRHEPVVERPDDRAGRVARLVEQVVAGHPLMTAEALGQRAPQVHDPVLEVRVAPELGHVRGVVGVPVLVLGARHRVQVDHAVDAMGGAHVDRARQPLEALLEQLEGPRVALEVAVVDRQPQAVDPQLGEQPRVGLVEEAVEQPVEEAVGPLRADHAGHRGPHRGLVGRIAGDEVLHVHPAAEPGAAQEHARAIGVDDRIAPYAQHSASSRNFRNPTATLSKNLR